VDETQGQQTDEKRQSKDQRLPQNKTPQIFATKLAPLHRMIKRGNHTE
jgi:hypothetical protein